MATENTQVKVAILLRNPLLEELDHMGPQELATHHLTENQTEVDREIIENNKVLATKAYKWLKNQDIHYEADDPPGRVPIINITIDKAELKKIPSETPDFIEEIRMLPKQKGFAISLAEHRAQNEETPESGKAIR